MQADQVEGRAAVQAREGGVGAPAGEMQRMEQVSEKAEGAGFAD